MSLRPNGPAYKAREYDRESHKRSFSNFRSGQCGEHTCEIFLNLRQQMLYTGDVVYCRFGNFHHIFFSRIALKDILLI